MVSLKKEDNGYAVLYKENRVGVIKYKDFWEGMPYLSLIKLEPEYRRKGLGKEAMRLFEHIMKKEGNGALLISTRVDEEAQYFYRKLGYRECGCLMLENTPFSQPMEMFFIKVL